MKKKNIMATLLVGIMAATTAVSAYAADTITVMVNGEKIAFADQQPLNINGRVMVPIRDVAEKMGWEVNFETYPGNTIVNGSFQDENHVIMKQIVDVGKDLGRNFIYLTNITMDTKSVVVGNSGYYEDEKTLKAAPVVKNGRTLLGVRDIAEGLHADVSWNSSTKTVEIQTKPVEQYAYYKELLAYVHEYEKVSDDWDEREKEQSASLTLAEEEQQLMENYAKEQNAKSDEFAAEVINLINDERAKEGLEKLQVNDTLMQAAKVRAEEIASNFSHTRPDGRKAKTAASDAGFPGDYVGENIAGSVNTPDGAAMVWRESDGHRNNYLKSEYTQTGAAYLYEKDSEYGSYWVQIFAK